MPGTVVPEVGNDTSGVSGMQVEDMVSFGIGAMVEVPCSVQATVESAQLGVYLAMDGIGKQRIV